MLKSSHACSHMNLLETMVKDCLMDFISFGHSLNESQI